METGFGIIELLSFQIIRTSTHRNHSHKCYSHTCPFSVTIQCRIQCNRHICKNCYKFLHMHANKIKLSSLGCPEGRTQYFHCTIMFIKNEHEAEAILIITKCNQ